MSHYVVVLIEVAGKATAEDLGCALGVVLPQAIAITTAEDKVTALQAAMR